MRTRENGENSALGAIMRGGFPQHFLFRGLSHLVLPLNCFFLPHGGVGQDRRGRGGNIGR